MSGKNSRRRPMGKFKKLTAAAAALLAAAICAFTGVFSGGVNYGDAYMDASAVAEYRAAPYVDINGGVPEFTEEDLQRGDFEEYSELDELGRCGRAFALITPATMPEEKRGSIGQVKPAGWHTVRYDDLIEDRYLYNRCHLIGFQLAGENANEKNLITGTRYMNVTGMLPFEDEVADYVKETGGAVLYRVSPIYEGDELLARGVQMEALSVDDGGRSICFNVFVYNVQPGIEIDYATGESRRQS